MEIRIIFGLFPDAINQAFDEGLLSEEDYEDYDENYDEDYE